MDECHRDCCCRLGAPELAAPAEHAADHLPATVWYIERMGVASHSRVLAYRPRGGDHRLLDQENPDETPPG
ncbi:unnamed protein product [Peniophora sp. CBMAI 1063]|nr:unnamed protein product [Peniophora sp. CBMAI 1063]